MLSNKEILCPNNLLDLAHKKKGVKVAVVNAGKPLPMLSVQDAVNENLIEPIFIGHEVEIQKCAEDIKWDISKYELIHEPVENDTAKIAAKLAREGKVQIIVKGHIHTDVLMKEVLKAPKDFIVGFVSQLIILPIVAYILILILKTPPEIAIGVMIIACLLYTSPSPRDATLSRMPSSA